MKPRKSKEGEGLVDITVSMSEALWDKVAWIASLDPELTTERVFGHCLRLGIKLTLESLEREGMKYEPMPTPIDKLAN